MIKLVSFNSGQLSMKFVKNKLISFVPVTVIENDKMAKVHR